MADSDYPGRFRAWRRCRFSPQMLMRSNEPPLLPNPCYAKGFMVVSVLRWLKYCKISSFVILDNFSLNLSLCWRIKLTASNCFSVVFIFFKFSLSVLGYWRKKQRKFIVSNPFEQGNCMLSKFYIKVFTKDRSINVNSLFHHPKVIKNVQWC